LFIHPAQAEPRFRIAQRGADAEPAQRFLVVSGAGPSVQIGDTHGGRGGAGALLRRPSQQIDGFGVVAGQAHAGVAQHAKLIQRLDQAMAGRVSDQRHPAIEVARDAVALHQQQPQFITGEVHGRVGVRTRVVRPPARFARRFTRRFPGRGGSGGRGLFQCLVEPVSGLAKVLFRPIGPGHVAVADQGGGQRVTMIGGAQQIQPGL